MDRLQELLGRIQELSDEELFELRDIITAQFDAMQADASAVHGEASLEQLESLAAAATAVNRERERRYQNVTRDHDARQVLASFRTDGRHPTVPADRRPRHVASGGVRPTAVTAAGIPIGDRNDLAARLVEAINGRQAPNSGDGRVRVGTIRSDGSRGAAAQRCRDRHSCDHGRRRGP
jgi:hypothetical protein